MAKKYVSNSTESTRMFKSNFMEIFSKVHFTVPLFLYIPVILYFTYRGFFINEVPILQGLGWILLGILSWTITEYVLHRFLFHFHPTSAFGKRIHFVFHGVHHDYPNDVLRLVMPPAVSIPLAFLFYFTFYFLIGGKVVPLFFVGFVMGYLFYDISHYALHHFNFRNKFWFQLKRHHMLHHYQDDEAGFGVSSKLWDLVFGTDFKKTSKP